MAILLQKPETRPLPLALHKSQLELKLYSACLEKERNKQNGPIPWYRTQNNDTREEIIGETLQDTGTKIFWRLQQLRKKKQQMTNGIVSN
jgi:hypothetical protein